jgi:hypothetical protein
MILIDIQDHIPNWVNSISLQQILFKFTELLRFLCSLSLTSWLLLPLAPWLLLLSTSLLLAKEKSMSKEGPLREEMKCSSAATEEHQLLYKLELITFNEIQDQ